MRCVRPGRDDTRAALRWPSSALSALDLPAFDWLRVLRAVTVLGVLLKEGAESPALKTIWANAPKSEGPEVTVANAKFDPAALVPKKLGYYSYEGSLTTPPCTEGVTFYILQTPAALSKAQVDAFPFKKNARPVQPLNGRKISAS